MIRDYKLYHVFTLRPGNWGKGECIADSGKKSVGGYSTFRRVTVEEDGYLFVYDIPGEDSLKAFKMWAEDAFGKRGYLARIEGSKGAYTASQQ